MAVGDDDRPGARRPTFTTPASGVRAITERQKRDDIAAAAERDRIDRLRGGRYDEDTPVDMPIPIQLAKQSERARATQNTTTDIQVRVGHLETGLHEARKEIANGLSDSRREIGFVAMQIVEVEGKVDGLSGNVLLLVEESKAARAERQAREVALELRAAAELAAKERQAERDAVLAKTEIEFHRQRWIDIVKIVSPIVAAIGVILAALAGAFK